MSYTVAQATPEIGVRMALGAQSGDVLRLVLQYGGAVALAGLVIGVPVALGLSRLLSSQLFGIAPHDPATFASVAAVLAAVSMAACLVPAIRAMRVDPNVALRYE
jgi:ABC-type antimicrobial peptide transport system permease subunit